MAGRFIISNYQRDDESNGPIKVQSETINTFNPAAEGSRTGSYVKVSGSRKSYGCHARTITLSRKVGTGADYNSATVSVRVPIMQKSVWDAISDGTVVTYQNLSDWVVVGQTAEATR